MQELSNEIREVAEQPLVNPEKHLRETAKKWASYVLEHNQGEALTYGLAISKALCDYINELDITEQ